MSFGGGDRERVDDARARQVVEVAEQPGEAARRVGQAQHAEPQRGAGERAADREHVVGAAELLGDIRHHPAVRRRRRREHRHARRHLRDEVAEPPVVGAEVVAPVADAVRLVDDEQADAAHERGQLLLAERRVVEPLGGDEQHVDLVAVERASTSAHSWAFVELIATARTPARSAAAIWSRMSASSGETSTVGPAPRRRSSSVATKYTADLPHPVRCTTSARRRPSTSASIASNCPSWNSASSRPTSSRSAASAAARVSAAWRPSRRRAGRWAVMLPTLAASRRQRCPVGYAGNRPRARPQRSARSAAASSRARGPRA